MTYMLDTNICIYAMKNKPEAVLRKLREDLEHGLSISSITAAELEYGMQKSARPKENQEALLRFLSILDILPFESPAAFEYGEIRAQLEKSGTPIGPMDLLIAAHARAAGLTLVTNNVKEFERVPGLKIENWAE